MWRDEALLVIGRGAVFPDRCMKSNQPAEGRRVQQAVNWHPPLLYLLHLGTPLIYYPIAFLVTKEAKFTVGLGERWFRIRQRRFVIAGVVIAVAIAAAVYGVTLFAKNGIQGSWFAAGAANSWFRGSRPPDRAG